MTSKLHTIGLKHKAEKTTLQCRTIGQDLSYLDIYDELFKSFDLSAKLNILEIGTRHGGSVKMWLEYFPNSHVYGFDNLSDNSALDLSNLGDRFTFIKGNQNNIDDLKKITNACPTFDLIIDDACHVIKSFVFTFEYLIDFLTIGGFYCIEDLYNSYKFWNTKENRGVGNPGGGVASNQDGQEFDGFIAKLTKAIHKSTTDLDFDCLGDPPPRVFSLQTFPGLLIARKTI